MYLRFPRQVASIRGILFSCHSSPTASASGARFVLSRLSLGPRPGAFPTSAAISHSFVQEASRLVFASIKGAQPRRKVAIPIPDDMTWPAFVAQLRAKLRLEHVGRVYLLNTGAEVASIEVLEDIDELIVDPAAHDVLPSPAASPMRRPERGPTPRAGPLAQQASTTTLEIEARSAAAPTVVARAGARPHPADAAGPGPEEEDDEDLKYDRRGGLLGPIVRRAQQLLAAAGVSVDGLAMGATPKERNRDAESLMGSGAGAIGARRARCVRQRRGAAYVGRGMGAQDGLRCVRGWSDDLRSRPAAVRGDSAVSDRFVPLPFPCPDPNDRSPFSPVQETERLARLE